MEIVTSLKLDIKKFFSEGYTVAAVDQAFADDLLQNIRLKDFSCSVQERAGWKDPKVAHWEHGNPSIFHLYWSYLSSSSYFTFFHRHFGTFSQGLPMSNRFSSGEGMAWHGDYYDGSFMTTMLYLSGDSYTEEDGGYLSLGMRLSFDSEEVFEIDKVLPNHGTLVVVNNLNPMFQHKVTPLVSNKERFTVMCHFGFIDVSKFSVGRPHTMHSTVGANLQELDRKNQ
jgi:hypothetical protein